MKLLGEGTVLTHPFVIGELALGNLRNRKAVLDDMRRLLQVIRATEEEVLVFIEANRLHGLGVGYVDAHLLASARLTMGARIWTRDQRLATIAERFDLRAEPIA